MFRFVITFLVTLFVSGPIAGFVAFASELGRGMAAFGHAGSSGGGSRGDPFYRFPMREDTGNTIMFNCAFWAVLLSLAIATFVTFVSTRKSKRRQGFPIGSQRSDFMRFKDH